MILNHLKCHHLFLLSFCNPNVTSRNIDPWLQEAAQMWSVAQGSGGTIHVSRENLAR